MGTFRVQIEIGDPQGQRWETADVLVDTGATYSWLSAELLRRLDVRPEFSIEFETADGRVIRRDAAHTRARLDGQERITIVVFGDEGSQSLLGAYILEGFLLAPDPVNERLIHVRGLAMAASFASHRSP